MLFLISILIYSRVGGSVLSKKKNGGGEREIESDRVREVGER